ncbi:MAG: PilZ domain-containing protein [Pseudomonadota bacterium]
MSQKDGGKASGKDVDKAPDETKQGPAAGAELRQNYRHPLHWRVALVYDNQGKNDIYHGRTNNLSVSGASIYLDHNIFMTEVVLLLAVPPRQIGARETIIEIQCRMVYTVLDGDDSRFRIGIHFVRFKGNGRKILTDLLSQRDAPKLPTEG